MRVRSLVLTLVLIAPALLSAAEWSEYASQQDFFSVVFPEKPAIEEITWKSEYGVTYPARVYTARDGASRFTVTVVNMADAEDRHRVQLRSSDIFDQGQGAYWQIDIMSSLQFVATQYRRRPGAKVTEDAFHYIDLVAGHQLHLHNADQTMTHVSLYLHKNRLYILEGTVPPRAAAPNVFTESLQFNDENGRRVRYQIITHNELPPSKYAGQRGQGQGQQQYPQGQGQGGARGQGQGQPAQPTGNR
jgi:hypothetical protein